jgi:hypothetical protein
MIRSRIRSWACPPARFRAGALLAVLVVTGAAPPRASAVVADAPGAEPARVVLVARSEAVSELAGWILDLVAGAVPGGVEIERIDELTSYEIFRLDRTDARSPTAWVIIDQATARVRVAGTDREQFVFRDLAISLPLGDLDRERICQTLRSALGAVVEGSVGDLGRSDAEQELGIAPAPPPPRAEVQAAERVAVAVPTRTAPEATEPSVAWGLGAFYKLQRTEIGPAQGPGIAATIRFNRWRPRPGAWLSAQYDIKQAIVTAPNDGTLWKEGASLRAGVSLSPARWLQIDLGGGVDVLQLTAPPGPMFTNPPPTVLVPAGRLAARFGIVDLLHIWASATVLLDVPSKSVLYWLYDYPEPPASFIAFVVYDTLSFRPGVALELWWR